MANGPAATETRHLRTLFALGAAGMLTDGQLLERFATLGGDPAELAFAALVERHGPMVLRVARSVVVDEHSAHDAFQATFLILARKARSLWVRDSLGPWLHAVAHRVASRSRAAEGRRKRQERGAARPEAYRNDDWDRSDLVRAIYQEIDRLPQPYRLAVVTCHLEGLTQHEAAARLGWPVGTLQSRLARGRQRLRDRLRRRGLAPSLGVLIGKLAPVPHALTASTAKAAATLHLGGMAAGLVAPAVLALIRTTTKGMLMTKLKLGAVALLVACGLVGSTWSVNFAQEAARGERPIATTPQPDRPAAADDPSPSHLLVPVPSDQPTGAVMRSSTPPGPQPEPIPPPADGPGFPILLDFHAAWDESSVHMRPRMVDLTRQGYPIKSIDIDRSKDIAARFKVDAIPTLIVVDGAGIEINRLKGEFSAAYVAGFYNNSRPKSEDRPAPKGEGPPEPSLDLLPPPRPWETVVRIKVHISDQEWGFGSGTIISSSSEESIILTCAHIFRVRGQLLSSPKDFRTPITVDTFDGTFTESQPAMVGCSVNDIPGEVIDYDFTPNVALIRIRPGKKMLAAPIVGPGWHPQKGMKMITVGCSHGQDATAWSTTILDPRVAMNNSSTKGAFFTIKCAHQPKEGRSGGGLYTADGYVAGVCAFADPDEHVGLYAVPEAIHRLLDRNRLTDLYRRPEAGDFWGVREPAKVEDGGALIEDPVAHPAARPARPRLVSDRERLDDLEQKLDQVLKALDALKGASASGQLKGDSHGRPLQR